MIAAGGPAGQEQAVWGGDQGRPVGDEQELAEEHGVQGDPPGEQAGRQQVKIERGDAQPDHCRQADGPFMLTEQAGGQPDGPGDHGRMIVVSQIQITAPLPVVGLIRRQQKLAADKNPDGQGAEQENPDELALGVGHVEHMVRCIGRKVDMDPLYTKKAGKRVDEACFFPGPGFRAGQ